MFEFCNLTDFSLAELTATFNQAFSDYVIPMSLTEDQFTDRFTAYDVNRELSVGVLAGDQLVAMIMHGDRTVAGQRHLYNAGTGVLPTARGNGLTLRMYEHLMPRLQQLHVSTVELEVIQGNEPAINSYRRAGFVKTANLLCFRGRVTEEVNLPDVEVTPLTDVELTTLDNFWSWTPTWQNRPASVVQLQDWQSLGLRSKGDLLAYALYSSNGRVHLFAVHPQHRRRGLGRQLFSVLQRECNSDLSMINVTETATDTVGFVTSLGLQEFLRQDYMALKVQGN